jgi:RNA polymerase nonessential primary-like sigma factor
LDGFEALKRTAGRYRLLTPEQEIELGRTIQTWQQWPGGPDAAPRSIQREGRRALDSFVLANQRLALHNAAKFDGHGIPLEDLAMAALENLITACKRFDPTRGFRFSSYATWYAMAACQQICHQQSTTIRLTAAMHTAIRKLTRARRDLSQELGRPATLAELAAATELSEEQILEVEQALHMNRIIAIDPQADEDERGVLSHNVIGDDGAHTLEEHDLRRCLDQAIHGRAALTPQQRFILRSLYLNDPPLNPSQIAQQLNCTKDHIAQLERHAIQQLRLDPLLSDWCPPAMIDSTPLPLPGWSPSLPPRLAPVPA